MALRFLNRWRRDRRGVSAIEFAFIAPIMILLYFGVAELCSAMLAQRKAQHVASEVGDLVAQCQQVGSSDFSSTGYWSVGSAVLYPLSSSNLSERVTSVIADSTDTKFTVGWSKDNGGSLTAYANGVTLTNTNFANLIPANGSIIMSESQYNYTSPVSIVIQSAIPFNSTFYLAPRQVTQIPWSTSATCLS
jgi:Flp pilus assembly protein TadG